MNCLHCQAPQRALYGPGYRPELTQIERGNWISLERCKQCGLYWCSSPYEPYAAFEYCVRWEHSQAVWRQIHDADEGLTLLRWHAASIREHWEHLPAEEREQVEFHRKRSYGHNPIDNPAAFGSADLDDLINA